SYIATAIAERNLGAIGYAVLVMLVVIILYDQLLFRPLLAWSQKFKDTLGDDEDNLRPWFLIVMQRAQLFDLVQAGVLTLNRGVDNIFTLLGRRLRLPFRASPTDAVAGSGWFEHAFDFALV